MPQATEFVEGRAVTHSQLHPAVQHRLLTVAKSLRCGAKLPFVGGKREGGPRQTRNPGKKERQ